MNEDYKFNIVKLAADGSNWVTYRDRMKYVLDTRGWSDHLTNDTVSQAYKNAGDVGGVKPEARWKADEALVRQLIVASMSDSVFNRIKSGINAKSVWDDLKKIFEGRTRSLLIDLGRKLQNTKCGEDDDVRAHFESLANFREQLAAMGQNISDEQYTNTLMSSLPPSYDANISIITTNADMASTTITSDTVVRIITDEYDKRMLKKAKPKSTQEEAFAAEAQKSKKKKRNMRNVECFNCHNKGHMKADCWAKGGGKEGQGPKKKTGANEDAAAASEKSQADDIEAWAVIEEVSEEVAESVYGPAIVEEPPLKVEVEAELYDSGASRHMSPFRHKFATYQSIPPRAVITADKRLFHAEGVGDLQIEVPNGKSSTSVLLKDTLYAPQIGLTIVSVGRIASAGYSVSFENDSCNIRKDEDQRIVGQIPANGNGLYKVEHAAMAGAALEQVNIHTLHRRLGHVSLDSIRRLVRTNAVAGLQIIDDHSPFFCDSCAHAKMTRKPIRKERTTPQATAFGEEVHTDLWGPAPVISLGGRKHYISLTDDYSRYTWLALLRTKDEALEAYKTFVAWAKTQHGATIKKLRSDRGGEYTGNEFKKFLQDEGSERGLTTHDTPQHNGISEALNRRLLERMRAMLHASGLPKNLWGEAINHAVWLKNRASTRALGKVTPFERLYGQKPNLGGVPEWGQRVWVHDDTGSKLDARANEAHWIGFDSDSPHAHRVYWMGKNSISVERNVKFVPITVTVYPPPSYETATLPTTTTSAAPPSAPPPTMPPTIQPTAPTAITPTRFGSIVVHPRPTFTRPASSPIQTPVSTSTLPPAEPPEPAIASEEEEADDEQERAPTQTPQAPKKKKKKKASDEPSEPERRSTRIPKLSEYMKRLAAGEGTTGEEYDVSDFVFSAEYHDIIVAAIHEADGDPKTLSEAQTRPDWPRWKEAMNRELATLERAGTWETVPRPPNTNVVGSKWVFRIKRKADGTIEKYKARLVARGFTQVYGIDYFDTFSPVAKLTSIRTLLAIAARNDWEIESFDFDGAYLNGELNADEVIYMQAPPGSSTTTEGTSVKRLKKSLYGLKQAGRRWYDTLSRALADLGFRTTQADPGVFLARVKEHVLILAIHVDDCIFTGDSAKLIAEFKNKLNKIYALTDLGPVHWLLGIKISRNRTNRTISLSQKTYINSILTRFALADVKAYATPIVPGVIYSRGDSPTSNTEEASMKTVPYREAIGSLMYASVATRPDISFAVSTLSQFLNNPGHAHWEAVKRIFRYLSGTRDYELTYGVERHDLLGYTDADGAVQEHRHAISGNVFLLDGGAISWSSQKQELVTLSTAEAEYVAATHAAKEAIWLRKLIFEIFPTLKAPTTLYCDNQAALRLATDDNYHARTKHIDIRYHFIRYVVASGALQLVYCPTDDMTADILTKGLPKWKVNFHVVSLGLRRA